MSRLTDPARLQKEIDAQKKRAEALALLSSSGGERHFKPGEVRKAREGKDGDNTLEVVTLRKAQQTYLEVSAKERLLRQQNSVREGVQKKQAAHAGAAAAAAAAAGGVGGGGVPPLREGWKEIKDPKTGSTYYWNKASNATSWERPVASPNDAPRGKPSGVGGGEKGTSSGAGSNSGSGQVAMGGQRTGSNVSAGAGAGAAAGAEKIPEKVPPLPPGWTEVKDPKTGGVYFWNKSKGATTWERPTGPANEGASASGSRGDTAGTPGLPEGWRAVTHAATGQTHYVHAATGKRSHTLPREGSQSEAASSSERQPHHQQGAGAGASHPGQGRGAGGAGSDGRNRGGSDRPKKKGRASNWAIDPLDPTGKTGGKWSDGLVQVGERMADSTASGPLWQQRPYPAPGKILRGRAPTEAETAGPRQR